MTRPLRIRSTLAFSGSVAMESLLIPPSLPVPPVPANDPVQGIAEALQDHGCMFCGRACEEGHTACHACRESVRGRALAEWDATRRPT